MPKRRRTPGPARGGGARSVWFDLNWLGRALFASASRWRVLGLIIAVLAVLLCNVIAQIELNKWNGAFFDSISAKDMAAFLQQTGRFFIVVAVLLSLVVAQTFLQELVKIELRRVLTRHLADLWLKQARPYRFGFAGAIGANPDQRLQEDTRKLAEFTAELGTALLQQIFVLTTFIGVLWTLSSSLHFIIGGQDMTIPGYMVWCALLYAGLGSLVTFLVGKPLIVLNAERSQKEAELRFALVRLNENAESIGFLRGEKDERRALDEPIDGVLGIMRAIAFKLARLTWVTSGYGWLSLIVPVLVAAPSYFASAMTFGGLMRLVDAFGQVQMSLRWFVDNFAKIADWRAALYRVMRFEEELRREDEAEAQLDGIALTHDSPDALALRNVTILLPNGHAIIHEVSFALRSGERGQLSGVPGAGKSTLLRAIAGLWPWGSGAIALPEAERMMFLPARPYLPLGSLRDAVCFPGKADAFDDVTVHAALERCGLKAFLDVLDQVARWDKDLTIGEQQRLTFARLILHRPDFVIMDEATSALDGPGQADLMRIFDDELKHAAVLLVSHRAGFETFASRRFLLVDSPAGSVLSEITPAGSSPSPGA